MSPCHQVSIRFTHNGQCCSTHTTLSIIVSICITRATLSYLDIATYNKFCSWIRVIKLTTHDCWLRPIWNNVLIKMMEVLSCFLDFYVYTEEDCRAECLHVQLCNVNREFYFGHEPSWWSEDLLVINCFSSFIFPGQSCNENYDFYLLHFYYLRKNLVRNISSVFILIQSQLWRTAVSMECKRFKTNTATIFILMSARYPNA